MWEIGETIDWARNPRLVWREDGLKIEQDPLPDDPRSVAILATPPDTFDPRMGCKRWAS